MCSYAQRWSYLLEIPPARFGGFFNFRNWIYGCQPLWPRGCLYPCYSVRFRCSVNSTNVCLEDNLACITMSVNPVCRKHSRHIDIRHHYIRDLSLSYLVKLVTVRTNLMVTDTLTKNRFDGSLWFPSTSSARGLYGSYWLNFWFAQKYVSSTDYFAWGREIISTIMCEEKWIFFFLFYFLKKECFFFTLLSMQSFQENLISGENVPWTLYSR